MAAPYTVIIPTRNRPEMLAVALKSVFAQTALATEILVVDNSPSSDLPAGSQTMDGHTYRVISAREASTAAAVRNHGLREAASRYVAFLDDDDEWLPEKMAQQLAYLEKHDECSAVVCGRSVVSPKGNFAELPNEDYVDKLLVYDNFAGSFSFIVFDRERCAGLALDESLPAYQDWDFLLRARRFGRIGLVPEILAIYHDHQAPRITNRLVGRRRALWQLLRNHRAQLPVDAKRWVLSRLHGLRAQEQAGGSAPFPEAIISVGRSLGWGFGCQLPLGMKVRALGGRVVGILPPGLYDTCHRALGRIKSMISPTAAVHSKA